jgi:hypothetical protein
MKTFNIALMSLVVAAASLAVATDADARGGRGHHSRARVGVFIGAPIFPYYYSPYYYPPSYYYPPAVVVPPAAPPVYIEQSTAPGAAVAAAPTQTQSAYWYFCPDSQTYYPYVQQCASPWQQVVPQASAAPQ